METELPSEENDSEIEYPTTMDPDFDPSQVGIESEVKEKRSATSKTFHKIDGTYKVAMYDDVIHYLENGEYKQVNNRLVDNGTTTEVFYYNEYRATDMMGNVDLRFRIVFKVGTPSTINIPLEHIRYTYSTSWKDQLVSYGEVHYDSSGNEIGLTTKKSYTYNQQDHDQGNPLSISNFVFEGITYHHADLEYTGRQLTNIKMYNASNVLQHEVTYTYNDQGYRTSKTIDSTTIEYTLSGDKVMLETDGTYGIIYTYDADGKIVSFSYDDNNHNGNSYTDYFYVRNQQGDITKIVRVNDSTKIVLVEYEYDAWGNILQIDYNSSYQTEAENVHDVNQYFYRGYRYDKEIDSYYLNSRFYDSNVGRFLNADGLLGEQGNMLGHNMYAYTQNNPVMYSDISGKFPVAILVTSIIIGLVAGGFELAMQYSDWETAGSKGNFWGQVDWFAIGIEGGSAAIFTALTLASLGSATAASSSWYMYSRLALTGTTQVLRGINEEASVTQILTSTTISVGFTYIFVKVGARPMASSYLDWLSPVERATALIGLQIARQTGMEAARFFSKQETWNEINSLLEYDYAN